MEAKNDESDRSGKPSTRILRPTGSRAIPNRSSLVVIVLAIAGVYEALSIPIAVFPATNFPRIIIGIDNGVMPIDQMEVTITRPIEEAVNSVPGLEDVRSTTSRGSAEVDLFFNWNVDMAQTLLLVNAALGRVQATLPSTAQIEANRLDFASFPILGYSLTSDKIPQTQLWEIATYELRPRLNRLNGVATVLVQGGQEPEFQITSRRRAHAAIQSHLAGHPGRRESHQSDRFAWPA